MTGDNPAPGPAPEHSPVRLQKLLAEAGQGSRRALEKRIEKVCQDQKEKRPDLYALGMG